jgi:hypothetical protein
VVPLPPLRIRATTWTAAAALNLGLGVMLFGPRRDLATAAFSPLLLMQVLLLLAAAVLSAIAALRLAVPGPDQPHARIISPAFAGWAGVIVGWHFASGGTLSALEVEPLHLSCATTLVSVALAPAAILTWMLQRSMVLSPTRTAVAAGSAFSSIGALAVTVVCPINRPPHLIVAHVLPAIVVSIVLAVLAASFIRRRPAAWLFGRRAPFC